MTTDNSADAITKQLSEASMPLPPSPDVDKLVNPQPKTQSKLTRKQRNAERRKLQATLPEKILTQEEVDALLTERGG